MCTRVPNDATFQEGSLCLLPDSDLRIIAHQPFMPLHHTTIKVVLYLGFPTPISLPQVPLSHQPTSGSPLPSAYLRFPTPISLPQVPQWSRWSG